MHHNDVIAVAFTMRYDWATSIAYPQSGISMSHLFGNRGDCVMLRQGKCPGKKLCPDCPWNQSCMEDGNHKHCRR